MTRWHVMDADDASVYCWTTDAFYAFNVYVRQEAKGHAVALERIEDMKRTTVKRSPAWKELMKK